MKRRIVAFFIALVAMFAVAAPANAADPITKEACYNALRGNHWRAPDHDIGRHAQNNLWHSWTGSPYWDYVKLNDYNIYGYVKYYNPIWPNTYTKKETHGYCSRFSDNSLGDRMETWPSSGG